MPQNWKFSVVPDTSDTQKLICHEKCNIDQGGALLELEKKEKFP